MQRNLLRLTMAALASALLCACGGGQANVKTPPAPPERPQPDLSAITSVLELMHALPEGDPVRQAELFEGTKEAAAATPTTSNKLNFALALATPGHAGSDPVAAQRHLAELLATPENLLPVERLLAMVALKDVEQRLILTSENKQLRDDAPRDTHEKLLAVNRRLAVEADDNVRLRKALDEARAKLEAVTLIERSINDRGTNATHP